MLRFEYHPPKSFEEFEEAILEYTRTKLKDDGAIRYGRNGQRQYGADILAHDKRIPQWKAWAIQCKLRNLSKTLSDSDMDDIDMDIKSCIINHQAVVFVIATTALRDIATTDFAIRMQAKHGIEVHTWHWDSIAQEIEPWIWRNRPDLFPPASMRYRANKAIPKATKAHFIDIMRNSKAACALLLLTFFAGMAQRDIGLGAHPLSVTIGLATLALVFTVTAALHVACYLSLWQTSILWKSESHSDEIIERSMQSFKLALCCGEQAAYILGEEASPQQDSQ